MSKLLLARHGNTFGPGDKIVWVGAGEDYPLVEKGEAQAAALGHALQAAGITLDRIITGPLIRTRRACEIIAELIGFDDEIEIDERLKEINYGSWGGKSCDEIIAEFGQEAHTTWNTHHTRPAGSDWSPAEDVVKANALSVMQDAAATDGLALVLTSNGVLRYMYGALGGVEADVKVKTGNICVAEISSDGGERVVWNEKPSVDVVKRGLE
ncbi:MAG: histidine phosphatase family protein [Maricaulis sp.]|nr:histidine phosphatase family protein [Maricaulis sp.]